MGNMRFKVGDRVRIKSLDWYNKNKDNYGSIYGGNGFCFWKNMARHCGEIMKITIVKVDPEDSNKGYYFMENSEERWTDEMIECNMEEETKNNNDVKEKETLLGWIKESDNLRLVPHKDYEIKHDGDNFYLVKKKKEYPKTLEECCKILGLLNVDLCFNAEYRSFDASKEQWKRLGLMNQFYQLLICRDAYWKIAGKEMGLDKPWEPDWKNLEESRYCIVNTEGDINLPEKILTKWILKVTNKILVFPTAEMRDAFKENFDPDIEICKELL